MWNKNFNWVNYEENNCVNKIDRIIAKEDRNNRFLLDDAWKYKHTLCKILNDLSWNKELVDTVTSNCRDSNQISNNHLSNYPKIINWLKDKEKKSSYGRNNDTKRTDYDIEQSRKQDKNLKEYMKWRRLSNIMLNHVLEHIVWDLILDIINDVTKDIDHIKDTEIRKTNEFDDVFWKTDYVVFFTTKIETRPFAIDLTTISDEFKIKEKENERQETILYDLSTNHSENKKIKMKRHVLPIEKKLAFSLIETYLSKINKWEKINSWDTIKMINNNIGDLKLVIQKKTIDILKKKRRARINQVIAKKQSTYKRIDIAI